jgi:hypothetical protein
MAHTKWLSILLAALVTSYCPSAQAAPSDDCLSYEPASVTLSGRVFKKVFPGPPNYESVEEGDEPEAAWILRLAKPICVKADAQFEFNVAVDNVSDIHLVLSGNQFSQVRRLSRKGTVILRGKLFHSFTGHHHTEVLMKVSLIKERR